MSKHPVADYFEDLSRKIRAGEISVSIEKTIPERAVVVEMYEGQIYEFEGDIINTEYQEVIRVKSNRGRVLS